MKVVVIIVTYNGMKWYKKCFDSLRNSSIPLDTIVIDNKSSDETVKFIRDNYPEIYLTESGSNLGFGKANNIGFKYAIEQNADYVFLLNQDAWVHSDTIERLIDKMEQQPEYGILSPIHLNGKEDALDFNFPYFIAADRCPDLISDFVVKKETEDKIYQAKFVNAALWLISKKCFMDVGGFDPVYPHYGEDENYIGRIEYHNYKLGIYPRVFGIHDRIESERRDVSMSNLTKKRYIQLLIIMTDPNSGMPLKLYRCFRDTIILSLNNSLKFSFKAAIIDTLAFVKLIPSLFEIRKNSKISRIKQPSFLK